MNSTITKELTIELNAALLDQWRAEIRRKWDLDEPVSDEGVEDGILHQLRQRRGYSICAPRVAPDLMNEAAGHGWRIKTVTLDGTLAAFELHWIHPRLSHDAKRTIGTQMLNGGWKGWTARECREERNDGSFGARYFEVTLPDGSQELHKKMAHVFEAHAEELAELEFGDDYFPSND